MVNSLIVYIFNRPKEAVHLVGAAGKSIDYLFSTLFVEVQFWLFKYLAP